MYETSGTNFGERRLVRLRSPRMIAGVCSGLAAYYGWDLSLVRVVAVVLTLCTLVAPFVYIAAWIIIPEGQYALPPAPPPPPTSYTESPTA